MNIYTHGTLSVTGARARDGGGGPIHDGGPGGTGAVPAAPRAPRAARAPRAVRVRGQAPAASAQRLPVPHPAPRPRRARLRLGRRTYHIGDHNTCQVWAFSH